MHENGRSSETVFLNKVTAHLGSVYMNRASPGTRAGPAGRGPRLLINFLCKKKFSLHGGRASPGCRDLT